MAVAHVEWPERFLKQLKPLAAAAGVLESTDLKACWNPRGAAGVVESTDLMDCWNQRAAASVVESTDLLAGWIRRPRSCWNQRA